MKLSFKKILAITITALTIGSATASSASAIDVVKNCALGTGFLELQVNYGQTHCLANAGHLNVDSDYWPYEKFWVNKISTGNNDIIWYADGKSHYLPRWHVLTFPSVGTVLLTGVDIL